jgi:putative CocE/NonD family hydrolase
MAERGARGVREVENVWIPMSDGVRLAARIFLPVDAEDDPVPALLEYIPYRKRDTARSTDDAVHPPLAAHGYACVRADIRGSGESDGLPQDEYVRREQDDALEIIAWLSAQPWCTGSVGMFGISWGGFSALQVAARRPPALKAIITHCSTDDRYRDDAHYTGGCINEGMFLWGSSWMTQGLLPPDPEIVGDGWRQQWLERLESRGFYVGDWLSHQRRDAFWRHGSIAEDYGAVECAVYAVGGWVDPYHSVVARLLEHLTCPRKGLVGPWGHQYPQFGSPGPAIDWHPEAVRWWDYWLRGVENDVMDEPMYRVWMQDAPALPGDAAVPGRWVAEETWPSPRISDVTLFVTGAGLADAELTEVEHVLEPAQTVGFTAPRWYPIGLDELPADQRPDDARSLTFDSLPLPDAMELLGTPSLELDVVVDRPVAALAVRLNEVDHVGVSRRITYGVLNLTHRDGHDAPAPLEPGRRYRVRVQLEHCAHRFASGNRLRLAVSSSYWPAVWPSPEPVRLTVLSGDGRLTLPVRPPRPADDTLRSFEHLPAAAKPPGIRSELEPASGTLRVRREMMSEATTSIGTKVTTASSEVSTIRDDEPTSATITCTNVIGLARGGWDTRVSSLLTMSLGRNTFELSCEVQAEEGGARIFERAWHLDIPRDLM